MKKFLRLKKILYSKCPHCREHGIAAFGKYGKRGSRTMQCKYCNKKFKINPALGIIIIVGSMLIGIGLITLISTYLFSAPGWIGGMIAILCWMLGEYFAPLENVE